MQKKNTDMASDEERKPLLGSSDHDGITYSNDKKTKDEESKKSKDENKKEKKSASFRELFRYATCFDVFLMLFGSFWSAVHGAGWPLLSIVFGEMTNDMVTKAPNSEGFSCDRNASFNASQDFMAPILPSNFTPNMTYNFEEEMTKYALYYVYIGAGVLVAGYLQVACWMTTCERQSHKIRQAFFKAILRQEIGWFDKHQSGELTTRLADDMERVREGLGDKFSMCIQFVAAFLTGFGVGFWKGWKMTLVMMSLTPLMAVCAAFIGKRFQNYTKREQESYAKAGGIAEEVLSCIRTVISFNGQKQEIKRYSIALEDSKRMGTRKSVISGIGLGFTMFIMFSSYALAFWFGNTQVEDWYNSHCVEGMSPGQILTVFFCVMIGSFSIGNATPHLGSVAAAKGGAAVIYEIIDNQPDIDASAEEGRKLDEVKGNMDFVGVNFSYPIRADVQVLKNFNMTIKSGQTVALVGASGCGKSTTINLLQRFYDPLSGHIYLDGHDIKELNIGWLRQNIGVVCQEPVLFDCTITENIQLGRPDATEDDIIKAAKNANAHDFISSLPQGYDTVVGERGAQLSGGQKQRVAIARALIRDPKILLLDEATSALDSTSEKIVQDALDKAREGRTTIMIAHRLSTIYNADVIYVIDDGELVEQGKHSELMEKKGTYHTLVTMQTIIEKQQDEEEYESDVAVFKVSESETTDAEYVGKDKRRRTASSSSDGNVTHQTSRQLSKQISVIRTKETDIEKIEEKEVDKPGFARMMRENKLEWPFIVVGTIAASINGATMPVFAIFFSQMIKVFMERGKNGVLWSLMFLALGFVNLVCHSIQASSFGQAGERLTMRLRLKVFTNLLRQDIAYFDDSKHSTGALTTRLATDASMVKNATGIRLAIVLQSLVGMGAALVIAFIFGWKLALVVLACVPVLVVAGAVQMRAIKGSQAKDQDQLEEAGKVASEAIENIRTVQSLTREKHFYDQYCKHLRKPYRMNLKNSQLYGLTFGCSQGVIFFLYAAAFRFGAYLVAQGEMEPDKVYRVFFAIAFTGVSLGQAASFLPDYTKAQHAAGLIFKLLDTVPKIDVYSEKGIFLDKITGNVQFKRVNFSYPSRPDVTVLKHLTISVNPGQTIALVGPSGCGKSTMVSLLQRFYDIDSGDILIDDKNVKDLHLTRLRSLLSVVSQEPVLFDCSIRDNIGYGMKDVSMENIIDAARTANIHEFITNLPTGYDTVVGEKGTQISGGQKQRIAIARALVRNPQILLLDEATSALDTESEKIVQSALDNAQAGRTCIVIAHRLSTIQNADCIFVIDNGEIVESGTHHHLLMKKGVYATLVNKQQLTN